MSTKLDILRQNGIKKLYHFTDRDNLRSIVENGGLFSWDYCVRHQIPIAKPGGSMTSRDLDCRVGCQNYVRISFTRNHPMMYVAQKDGRITNPIILEISLEVVDLPGTRFSDRNAAKNGAKIGGTLEDLKRIHFHTVKAPRHFDVSEDEQPFFQAEVLIKESIPLSYITNIADFGIPIASRMQPVPMSKPQVAMNTNAALTISSRVTPNIRLRSAYTAQISREFPTAFIFLVDHSISMRATTKLYGKDMSCAAAVAQILNHQIYELVNRCIKMNETRHYYDIAVIGYGAEVYSAWGGALAGRDFVSPQELQLNPLEKVKITKEVSIRGKKITREVEEVRWFAPRCDGNWTKAHLAFDKAKSLAEQWIENHDSKCYPPTIIHITDGEFNGSTLDQRTQLANEIKALYTSDGNVLFFNVHITPNQTESVAFPATRIELNSNRYAEELYDLSSLLPKVYNERIAQLQEITQDVRLSAMAVNMDMQQLVKIMDIGTPTNIQNAQS